MNDIAKTRQIQQLVSTLNEYRDAYYNRQSSPVSDEHYDMLYDRLVTLEQETGLIISGSPTQTVGYKVKSKLNKVHHNHPMLSLDKTKSVKDLVAFLDNRLGVMMLKLDGLTVSLRYVHGKLVSAETRGNGAIGEDILHNAMVFENVPLYIDCEEEVVVDGEAIIDYENFERINSTLPDDQKYKNPRNLASGSVRQLDSRIAKERHVKFVAWKLVKGNVHDSFSDQLIDLLHLGFEVTPFTKVVADETEIERAIALLKDSARALCYPIDGMVLGYDDAIYGDSLGATSHHVRSQIAYKFYDEESETTLLDIEWTIGKTGLLTPTAVFAPVDIDGTCIERASLHNISVMTDTLGLTPHRGQSVWVVKCNQIIPQIARADKTECSDESLWFRVPGKCPVCGGLTKIDGDTDTMFLSCINPDCKGKFLGKLTHFVSKDSMDIRRLSDVTLDRLVQRGLLSSMSDIYLLHLKRDEIMSIEGMGATSTDALLRAIEDSRTTTLAQFINALSIPMVGKTLSIAISKACDDDIETFLSHLQDKDYNWQRIDGIGSEMEYAIKKFAENHFDSTVKLAKFMAFKVKNKPTSNILNDFVFAITGSLHHFKNRDELAERITSLGGKVVGSVSTKTDYLINNDTQSASSKNQKAKKFGVKIISEDDFLKLIEE